MRPYKFTLITIAVSTFVFFQLPMTAMHAAETSAEKAPQVMPVFNAAHQAASEAVVHRLNNSYGTTFGDGTAPVREPVDGVLITERNPHSKPKFPNYTSPDGSVSSAGHTLTVTIDSMESNGDKVCLACPHTTTVYTFDAKAGTITVASTTGVEQWGLAVSDRKKLVSGSKEFLRALKAMQAQVKSLVTEVLSKSDIRALRKISHILDKAIRKVTKRTDLDGPILIID